VSASLPRCDTLRSNLHRLRRARCPPCRLCLLRPLRRPPPQHRPRHSTPAPVSQLPAWHVPFVHTVPSGFGSSSHPWVGSQPVLCVHSPEGVHVTPYPVHCRAAQVSCAVHALPSSHVVPASSSQTPFSEATAVTEQVSQGPAAQTSLQHTPSAQWPLPHASAVEHGAPGGSSEPRSS
jgi:hypothetical protein